MNAMQNAAYLREALEDTGKVGRRLLYMCHVCVRPGTTRPIRPRTQVIIVDKAHMPLVAFALKPELKLPYTVFEIQDKLRERG